MGDRSNRSALVLVGVLLLFFLFAMYMQGGKTSPFSSMTVVDVNNSKVSSSMILVFTVIVAVSLLYMSEKSASSSMSYNSEIESLFSRARYYYNKSNYGELEKTMAEINSAYQGLPENVKEEVYDRVLDFYEEIRR